jgi:hypothetical protein
LKLHGIIAGVEDEQRDGALLLRPAEQGFDLLGGGHVGLPIRMDARGIHREVQLSRAKLSRAMNW